MAGEVEKLVVPVGFRFYKDLIVAMATRVGADPAMIAAICWRESEFCTDAYRFEPDFWNRYLKANPLYRALNPRRVSASYGLMQVMYCRVHEDQILDNDALPPEHLFVPEMGLRSGIDNYLELLAWARTRVLPENVKTTPEFIALCAYNGGRGGNDPAKNWPLRNGKYASEVLARFAVITKEFA